METSLLTNIVFILLQYLCSRGGKTFHTGVNRSGSTSSFLARRGKGGMISPSPLHPPSPYTICLHFAYLHEFPRYRTFSLLARASDGERCRMRFVRAPFLCSLPVTKYELLVCGITIFYFWIEVLKKGRLFLWLFLIFFPFLPALLPHSAKLPLVQRVPDTYAFSTLFQKGRVKKTNKETKPNSVPHIWMWMAFKCEKQRTGYFSLSFQGNRLFHCTAMRYDSRSFFWGYRNMAQLTRVLSTGVQGNEV